MKKIVLLGMILILSCKEKTSKKENSSNIVEITETYELIKPIDDKALLIVFPGGGATSKETKEEFKIVKEATANGISVLLMNFNRSLWIDENDAKNLSEDINQIILKNQLKTENIYIGGMSIGGNVALSLANFMSAENTDSKIKGVFIVDAPIDLNALYESSQKDVLRKDFSEERLAEPKFIISYFEDQFGGSDSLLSNIQNVSPVTYRTRNTQKIAALKNLKLRLYTEPDTLWWRETRQTDFENTNAFTLQKTYEMLHDLKWTEIELIQTKNKGYRIDGQRNPHSWSIVNTEELIQWILN